MKKSLGPRTLVYPTPVFVVGTYDAQGKPNVMTASWGGTFELGSHTQFVGEVLDVKVDETALADGGTTADIHKVRPLVFTPDSQAYYGIGGVVAQAFSVGTTV